MSMTPATRGVVAGTVGVARGGPATHRPRWRRDGAGSDEGGLLMDTAVSARTLDLTQHPLGALVPAMTDTEFRDLVTSVRQHGVQEPCLLLYEGQVLDGWHRDRGRRPGAHGGLRGRRSLGRGHAGERRPAAFDAAPAGGSVRGGAQGARGSRGETPRREPARARGCDKCRNLGRHRTVALQPVYAPQQRRAPVCRVRPHAGVGHAASGRGER